MSEVLILVDSVAGKVSKSTGELATFAKAIGKVNAVVFDAALVSQLSAYAIDNVIVCAGVDVSKFSPGPVAQTLAQLVARSGPIEIKVIVCPLLSQRLLAR